MQDDEGCPFSGKIDPPRFPFKRDKPFELPAEYALARENCPVAPIVLWNDQFVVQRVVLSVLFDVGCQILLQLSRERAGSSLQWWPASADGAREVRIPAGIRSRAGVRLHRL